MQTINALSLTQTVKDWLADTRQPRILHVFDNACNLINEKKDVLSIVSPQIGNGPFNIVIEDDKCFTEQLSLRSQVSVSRTQFILGDLTFRIADGKLWNPRPDWEVLHTKRDDIVCQIASLPITDYLKLGDFEMPLEDHSGLFNRQQLPITRFSNSLVSSLAFADIALARTITSQLAGLGQGLTPAGDDFIMGAVLAAWIIQPQDVASPLAYEITNDAASLTTSLSGAWLKSTGRGEAGQIWHGLFDALISADKMVVQESINNILAVGHTSGADALSGFLSVFKFYLEQK